MLLGKEKRLSQYVICRSSQSLKLSRPAGERMLSTVCHKTGKTKKELKTQDMVKIDRRSVMHFWTPTGSTFSSPHSSKGSFGVHTCDVVREKVSFFPSLNTFFPPDECCIIAVTAQILLQAFRRISVHWHDEKGSSPGEQNTEADWATGRYLRT